MDANLQLALWIALSLLASTVAVNAAYHLQAGELLQWSEETALGSIAREAGLFACMIGIPFAALISGAAGLDLMALGADLGVPGNIAGFTFANWVRGGGVAAIVAGSVLAVVWMGGRAAPSSVPWSPGPLAIRDAFYSEVHWTFYRAAPSLWFNDPYWGMVAGTAMVLVEWATHPDTRPMLDSIEGRQYLTLRLACLSSSAFLYLATHNLWLMIAANLAIQVVGSRLLAKVRDAGRELEMRD